MDKYYRQKGEKLLALFFLGILLFNYPVITIFTVDGMLWGIPVLYVYFFFTWTVLIGLTALIIEQRR